LDAILGGNNPFGEAFSEMTRVSIITVNRNNASELEHTIESVKSNAPENCQYIIIDGASTDGSVDAIRQSSKYVDSWISEPDNGIYCAMNKGIARASGDYCLFLNSGDILCADNGLHDLPEETHDVFYSDALLNCGYKRRIIEYPTDIDVNFFVSGMINHQNSLIRLELFQRIGLYDEDYSICADWLFFLKAAYYGKASFCHLSKPIVEFAVGGVSSRPGSDAIIKKERNDGLVEVFRELAPSILELQGFRDSIYGNIVKRFGTSKMLDFFLRFYRFLLKLSRG
jgi:glycosyltransferase involved in cell wall biosynthesis